MRRFLLAILVLLTAAGSLAAENPVFTAAARWDGDVGGTGAPAVVVTIGVKPGWHINSNRPLDEFLIPTRVTVDAPALWTVGPAAFPPHRALKLAFSEGPVAVFEGAVEVRVPLRAAAGAQRPAVLRGVVEAQACNDQLCLPPAEVSFSVAVPADGAAVVPAGAATPAAGQPPQASPAATAGLGVGFAGRALAVQLLLVFLAGLALNLTPCVYPLIPITVGFFIAQKEAGRARTWLLAVVYVLGMSGTYSSLGVAAALSGKLFGAALQSPWVTGLIVAVMVALATSMFGLWELRVPAWATRLSGGRAGWTGALIMGLVVGLVAAPCIGPFVLGLLTYVGQQGDATLGFLMFFTLSLGLGLPYLFLATSTRALDRLPNSGVWMLGVRQLFGVMLLGLGAYFLRPLLPGAVGDWVLAGVLVSGGLFLLVVSRPGAEQPAVDRAMRLACAALIVAGVLLAPSGGAQARGGLAWQAYDEARVTAAIKAGRPVILDFYATWCLPCKELDEKTFSAPAVAARLSAFERFKVDLTQSDAGTEGLRTRYGVAGVPTIVFYTRGTEVAAARLTGFEAAEAFLSRLNLVESK